MILKIRFFLFLILVFSKLSIVSQNTVSVFEDNFYDNKNNWTLNKYSNIKNGNFYGTCDGKHIFRMFFQDVKINPKKDYYIETSINNVATNDTTFYGIVWGADSWENSLIYDISPLGIFRIYGYKKGELFLIKRTAYTKKGLVQKQNYNKLAIKKQGNGLSFFINDVKVHSTLSYPLLGSYIGLIVSKNAAFKSDYLIVKAQKNKINLVNSKISKYSKKNMGLNINSPYSEIAPVISPDGNTLWIARANHPLNTKPINKFDIWFSTKNEKGVWGEMKKAPFPLNNSGDNVVISVSPDNNTLFLETLYNSDGSFKSDQGISISHRTISGWSVPKRIVIEDYYNNNIYESFAFSVDKKVLVMSVERNDGFGEKDMYVSFLKKNGTYSKPKNMGNVLNSYLGEGTPYIAPDNKTLYYYSITESGYGNADIFVSKRLDNTWTKWSTPRNLGNKINSTQWDVYYTVAAKGDYAYLVSSQSSFGNEDIFKIKLREEEKPEAVVIVYGKVLDITTNKPIKASIVYENNKTGKVFGRANSNPKTGEYKIVLPYGNKYNIRASKDGYFAMNEVIDIKTKKNYKEIKKTLLMSPLKKEEPILLKDVNFYSTKAKLLPSAYSELNRLINLMNTNSAIVIELQGHTEQQAGYEKQLQKLSELRTQEVKNYLVLKGIDKNRIRAKAFGGTKPLFSNETEQGRKKNRRVEFKILQK